ncbi:MAG TPA: hypothetical protein VFR94_04285 [Nitrososphaeraceae archaeon]|nr:hypothetical protein [Nitrososphaeraceae archaeon]
MSILKYQIFCRSDRSIALLECRQAQWFVRYTQNENIDGWWLGRDDYELVGDLDGEGLDEIYIRSPRWAGVLKWKEGQLQVL